MEQRTLFMWGFVFVAAHWPARGVGQPAGSIDSVWVNTRSRIYHCAGTEFYGRTTRGEYLPESTAVARGYRANGGRTCEPSPPRRSSLLGSPPDVVPAPPATPQGELQSCVVERLVDGDTFQCRGLGAVRLIATDAPERSDPHGDASAAALASLMPLRSTVLLEMDTQRRDQYNRTLAYVWLDGHMLNWWLIRQGWGVAEAYPGTQRYAAQFGEAEEAARREQRGLWHLDGFRCRPRRSRDKSC